MANDSNPYIDNSGNIIVPFNAESKYHYWNGGQKLSDTLLEIKASEDSWKKHTEKPYPGNAS